MYVCDCDLAAVDDLVAKLEGPVPVIELPARDDDKHQDIEHPEDMVSNHGRQS